MRNWDLQFPLGAAIDKKWRSISFSNNMLDDAASAVADTMTTCAMSSDDHFCKDTHI